MTPNHVPWGKDLFDPAYPLYSEVVNGITELDRRWLDRNLRPWTRCLWTWIWVEAA